MTDGFANRLTLDRIRDGDRIELAADEQERQKIADRLGLRSLSRLEAHAALSRTGGNIRASGRLRATLEQSCVVTNEAVVAHLDEPFDLLFVPEPGGPAKDEEIELSSSELDMIFHDGAAIELGDAIADTLALSLDPYPRSAGAEAALKEAGVMGEEEAGPFAALAQLKRNLGGDES